MPGDVRCFLRKLALFLLLQLAVGAFLGSTYRSNPDDYTALTRLKHERLRASPRPRLVIIGGSSVTFGFSSPEAERLLPEYTPINMGIAAGTGFDYQLAEVFDELGDGDLLVLSPEYSLMEGHVTGLFLLQVIEQRKENLQYIPWHYAGHLLDSAFEYAGAVVRGAVRELAGRQRQAAAPYAVSACNAYGEIEVFPPIKPIGKSARQIPSRPPTEWTDRVNAAIRTLRERGVQVVYAFPPRPSVEVEECTQDLQKLEEFFRRNLDAPLLYPGDVSGFDPEYIYNTGYHLTAEGARQRTRLIADGIRRLIAQGHLRPPPTPTSLQP